MKREKTSQSRESVEESQSTRPNCSNPSHPSCARKKTLREAKKTIHEANIAAIGSEREPLPDVSVSSIHRYVRNEAAMNEVEIGPLSFTQVSTRGPAANSDENKDLRVRRRQELDSYIRAGYMVVFVDESHWSVGNVRTRSWGPKGQKHFRNDKPRLVLAELHLLRE